MTSNATTDPHTPERTAHAVPPFRHAQEGPMRLRNASGSPLEIRLFGVTVGADQEIDTADLIDGGGVAYDTTVHGVITGFVPVDVPAKPKSGKAATDKEASL
jgi:hypothetical protein